MNNDKFQPIPNRAEIIPDVESFRFSEDDKSYYLDGIIILPDKTEVKAVIRYKQQFDEDDEIFRPIEYREVTDG